MHQKYISTPCGPDILAGMKHLVDLDEDLLANARSALGTSTIKDTVNEALRRAAQQRRQELNAAVDGLAELVGEMPIHDRSEAW